MVFTLAASCLLLIATALVVVLVKAARRSSTRSADPPVPTLTIAAGPGWYSENDGSKRYWDGRHWTAITREAPPAGGAGRDA